MPRGWQLDDFKWHCLPTFFTIAFIWFQSTIYITNKTANRWKVLCELIMFANTKFIKFNTVQATWTKNERMWSAVEQVPLLTISQTLSQYKKSLARTSYKKRADTFSQLRSSHCSKRPIRKVNHKYLSHRLHFTCCLQFCVILPVILLTAWSVKQNKLQSI